MEDTLQALETSAVSLYSCSDVGGNCAETGDNPVVNVQSPVVVDNSVKTVDMMPAVVDSPVAGAAGKTVAAAVFVVDIPAVDTLVSADTH